MFVSGSVRDLAILSGQANIIGRRSTSGRTRRFPALDPSENTGVFIIAGQSLAGNSNGTLYTPTNAGKVDNLNIFDGGLYAAVDPLLGTGGDLGNWAGRLGDHLINDDKFDRVILVPIAVGGTPISAWVPGGEFNQLFGAAFQTCTDRGYPINGILWQHGEQDASLGTSTATYVAGLTYLIQSVINLGLTAPWFVAKSSTIGGVATPAIAAAQAQIVNGTNIFAGANTDTLDGSKRTDGTHLTATGCEENATMWAAVL